MAQPAQYLRQYNFTNFQTVSPTTPLPADKVDLEFNSLKATLDQTLANLKLIQRDDTALASKSVGIDQLKDEVSIGVNAPGPWVTAKAYAVGDSVVTSAVFYRCIVSHVSSGAFATDLAAGKWTLIADFNSVVVDLGAGINGATPKPFLVDQDEFGLANSGALYAIAKVTWAGLKSALFAAWGSLIAGGVAKATPVDGDSFAYMDSAASNATKVTTWAALKAALASSFLPLAGGSLGSNTKQSNALLGARASGSNIEFGNANPAGYGSALGSDTGAGNPWLAFSAEAGSTINTYRTRGLKGSLLKGDLAGGFEMRTVANALADNQVAALIASLTADGTFWAANGIWGAGGVYDGTVRVNSPNNPPPPNRNKLINPNFPINQLAVSGTVTLTAGAYGHDGWKAGASGCTYTFATTANVTTLTITAGSLQQVIEGANLYSGNHTLSWQGTAQGKIGAGSYGASGITSTVTGGSNLTIEFGAGTLSQPQFEVGGFGSPFEQRSIQQELALCQRYFVSMGGSANFEVFATGEVANATAAYCYAKMPVRMMATPTMAVSGAVALLAGSTVAISVSAVSINAGSPDGLLLQCTATGMTAGWAAHLTPNNNTTARITFSARL